MKGAALIRVESSETKGPNRSGSGPLFSAVPILSLRRCCYVTCNVIQRRAIVAAIAIGLISLAAVPAAADSSACTHHPFSGGPQVCIRLEGRNEVNSVTAIWTNPPRGENSRRSWLSINGEKVGAGTAQRVGRTLSYTWERMQTGTGKKICVGFAGVGSRIACQSTVYIGDRAT